MTLDTQVKQGLTNAPYINTNPEILQSIQEQKELPKFDSPYFMAESRSSRVERMGNSPYLGTFTSPRTVNRETAG